MASRSRVLSGIGRPRTSRIKRRYQGIVASTFQTHSRQEIRADHLEAIASGLVAPQHQRGRLERLLNHRQLALVSLK